jgi:ribosomal protein S20
MLFDLRGRRRRAVQVTYLTLAVLMGGGLVLFGIGGNTSGGLFDAFKDNNSSPGDQQAEKRVEKNKKALARNPRNAAVLKALVRDEYQLATSKLPQNAIAFPKEAHPQLRAASGHWQRYLKLEKGKPDPALASVALRLYDPGALNKPRYALQAATIVAEDQRNSAGYIRVVQYATLAGDKRTTDLAAQKAIDLAPKSAKKTIKQQVKQAKQAAKPAPRKGARGGGGATP